MDAPATTTVSRENADDILGQFYFAFGQGATSMRVDRTAIAAFRHRYFDRIVSAPGPWKAAAPNVLAFVEQVGRLCALLATQAGRTAITAHEVRRACPIVEASVHRSADQQNILILGPHCTGDVLDEEIPADDEDSASVPRDETSRQETVHRQM
jgi:hypothetical protein